MSQAIRENLRDAGCPEDSVQTVERLVMEGYLADALHLMRVLRCDLIEELHQSQRKVDCIDYLIRKTENEIKTT